MLQLGAQDSQFLFMETEENLSNITMICIYQKADTIAAGKVFDTVRSHIKSRLHTSAIFKRKLVRVPMDLDYPYWVDDNFFDLDYHLHRHTLESPGNWQQLTELMGVIHSRPLDMNRPLWEFHLVENINAVADVPRGSFAIIAKIHHCAVDGAATLKFFAGISDIDANGTPAVDLSEQAAPAGAAPSYTELFKRGLTNSIESPFKIAKSLLTAVPSAVPMIINQLSSKSAKEPSAAVPTTRLNQYVAPRKIFDGVEFALDDFKLIKAAVDGAKINDVVLAVISGAMREYLSTSDMLPDHPLVAWVPINARKGGENDSDGGNQVTVMTTNLYSDLSDPVSRLQRITEYTQKSKAKQTGAAAGLLTDFSQQLPGAMVAVISRAILASGVTAKLCNLAVSNVPGINVPMYMAGNKCLKQYGMVPLGQGMGLFIVAISYNGKLSLSITSTRDIVPDTKLLCQCLHHSFDELKAQVSGKGKAAVRRPASGKGRVHDKA